MSFSLVRPSYTSSQKKEGKGKKAKENERKQERPEQLSYDCRSTSKREGANRNKEKRVCQHYYLIDHFTALEGHNKIEVSNK